MKLLHQQINSPKMDVWLFYGSALIGAVMALVVIPDTRAVIACVVLSGVNLFNGWRLHRRIKPTTRA